MLVRLLFLLCLAGLAHAEDPAFLPLETVLKDPAWTLNYCPLVERSVTFRSGTLLQAKGAEDEVRSIYVTFLERKAELKLLPAEERAVVIQSVIVPPDIKDQPLIGWSAVALLEATHPQRPEPLRWLVFMLYNGIIACEPGAQLYDPRMEATGGSRFYQALGGDEARKFMFHIRNEKVGEMFSGKDGSSAR